MIIQKISCTIIALLTLCGALLAQNNGLDDVDFNLVRDYEGTIECG